MAKKNIITDFSALKGKVSFSGQNSVVQRVEAKDKSGAEGKVKTVSEKSERGLQVGMKVVLMDSDLRGTIVSLGKTVGIELEDGLTIQTSYNEFAVTDSEEIKTLKLSKVKAKKSVSNRRTASPSGSSNMNIDLHIEDLSGGSVIPKGQQLQFQMDVFRRVIRENLHHRGMTITFIHGIGDGILKAAIRKELDEVLALRCSYSVGDPAVTVVTIK